MLAKHALSQLSYGPQKSEVRGQKIKAIRISDLLLISDLLTF
jgi:hypothetical protein